MKRPIQYFSKEVLEIGQKLTTKQIVEYLENFRLLHSSQNQGKAKLISIKIPQVLLDTFKVHAAQQGVPYQTLIKQLMRDYVTRRY